MIDCGLGLCRTVDKYDVDQLIRQYTGKAALGSNPITEYIEAKHKFYLSDESGEDLAGYNIEATKPYTYFSYNHII